MDYSMPVNPKKINIEPSKIETIDEGFIKWVDEELDLHTGTNSGFQKTPVIWLGTERAYQIKNDKSLRDSVGKLKLPLITITRTSMVKDPAFRGAFQAI